jgi:signal transduction histidine kinase
MSFAPIAPPQLPQPQAAVLARLLDALAGEHHVPSTAVELIASDPALTVWVLSTMAPTEAARPIPPLPTAWASLGTESLKILSQHSALAMLSEPGHTPSGPSDWLLALRCACLCENLARTLGYPHTHEAYLAGLLHNLEFTGVSARDRPGYLADHVEAWNYNSFLADALRYQGLGHQILRDATTLVQILGAARALVAEEDSTPVVAIASMLGLDLEVLGRIRVESDARAENIHQELAIAPDTGLSEKGQTAQDTHGDRGEPTVPRIPKAQVIYLRKSMSRFASLEHLVAAMAETDGEFPGVAATARHLVEVHGLEAPVFFRFDKQVGKLLTQPLGKDSPPALAITVEGSNAAAAKALSRRSPVIVLTDGDSVGVSLLDSQLSRLARREGILAIPIGNEEPQGVLVACGYRSQLVALGEDMVYLAKLGLLAGRPLPVPGTTTDDRELEEQRRLWNMRARHLAHEINNPLGIIKNYLALLRVKLGDNAIVSDDLRIIHEELDRIARIVHKLATENVEVLASDTDVDVNALLGDLVKVAAPGLMLQKLVKVESRLEEGLPKLHCDRDKLKQMLLNLVLNAIEASQAEGTISLETHRIFSHNQKSQLEILITNTGEEIAPEVLAHLFEPVETAKGAGHAGLGLAIVKSLADELNATVACRSHNGRTTFHILLPLG